MAALAPKATEIGQLGPIASEIAEVAGIKTEITSLDEIKTDISAVSAKTVELSGVYAKLAEIEAVYGKSTEIDALYAQLDEIAEKANTVSPTFDASASPVTITNTGTGNSIEAPNFSVAKNGEITSPTIDAMEGRLDIAEDDIDDLQVKTAENDLAIADILRDQTLENQSESSIDASDYGVVALPKNATGTLKMKRDGLTARNLIPKATLPVTQTLNGITFTNNGDGTITVNGTATDNAYVSIPNITVIVDDDYFLAGCPTGDGASYRLYNQYWGLSDMGSGVIGTAAGTVVALRIYVYSGATISNLVFNPRLINLTQTFSSVPTLAQCKNIFPTYFADTKNVPMTGRYRGRGKNIFKSDGDFTYTNFGATISGYGQEFKVSGTSYGYPYKKVMTVHKNSLPSGIWLLTSTLVSGSSSIITRLVDRTVNPAVVQAVPYTSTGVHNELSVEIALSTDTYDDTLVIQLEQSATATTYEPYEAHDLYFTAPEGRSILGVEDSVEVSDGVLVHVQRISNSVAVSSGVAVNVANYPLAKTSGNFRVELTAGGVQIGVIGTDSTSGAGTLTYVLTTEVKTNIDQDGSLPAGESVYFEPVIADVGIYTDKFDILDTDYPISSIDKLYKVDFSTGVQTQLTNAVIASDGLSFTSASLTDGDLVNVIYFYATANPEGLTTATYLNSNVVVADTTNGKYYKYKPTITNGAIASWTLTEVV
jgi:hypothetical protein